MTPFRGDNPYGNHPRASALGLTNEKVVKISASNIRCSVVTESGKIATWLDESVAHVCARLEHPATAFAEFGGDKVKLAYHAASKRWLTTRQDKLQFMERQVTV